MTCSGECVRDVLAEEERGEASDPGGAEGRPLLRAEEEEQPGRQEVAGRAPHPRGPGDNLPTHLFWHLCV